MSAGPMNAERLLAHYEKIADAPDAIARLRRFVLDLAVRGKLVPQDANDEPAEELLKRIAKEKARLVKAGEIRKPRDLDGGDHLNEPFSVPPTWRWVRLDAVGAIVGGGTPPAADPGNFTEPGEGIPWLTPADLGGYSDLYISRGSRDLTEKGSRASSATVMPKGTVLFTSRAPIGYVAIAANPISTNQGFKSIVPYILDCSHFIATAMKAFAPEIDAKAPGTTFKEVSGKIVAGISFPLPPLAEQQRIVAKVDELMGLCDRLEAARAGREAVRDKLTAASLVRLNAPDPETFQADARFALGALPALTTRPDQIRQLRQTILNLAVRGKLVPQDSKEKVAKRYDAEPQSDSFPPNWRLLNFEKFCDIQGGNQPPKSRFIDQPKEGYVRLLQIRDLGERPVPTFIPIGSTNRFCKEGEILIGRYGASVGKIFWAKDGAYNVALAKFIWPQDALIAPFAFLLLKSAYFQDHLAGATRSAQAGFNKGDLAAVNFPLPPLGEQRRISAKMDELTALCDRLEASLTATAATSRRLLDALLAEALAPAEDREMEAAE